MSDDKLPPRLVRKEVDLRKGQVQCECTVKLDDGSVKLCKFIANHVGSHETYCGTIWKE